MKSILLFILLFASFFLTYSQLNSNIERINNKIDNGTELIEPTYFVLGTLSDYMGRFEYISRKIQVDRYYDFEKPLVYFLNEYIKSELRIEVNINEDKSNQIEMFSEQLSIILNIFYGENDELLSNKFDTKKQIFSFLAGVYYRYGNKLDTSIYVIHLTNSPKHQNCYELLKRIGCKKIFYHFRDNIPSQHIIYFEPTQELKKYLEFIEPQKIILENSNFNNILELNKGHFSKKKLELDFKKSKKEDLDKIRGVFYE